MVSEKLHIIMPIKDSLEIAEKAIRSIVDSGHTLCIYDDNSLPEKQSEDLIMYLLKEFEENPVKIWDSNIFGKSLHELVNEGLHAKLAHMPTDARIRLQETLERVINEGCNGLVSIIL